MDRKRLEEIEARANAATKAPWTTGGDPADLRRDQGYQPAWVVIGGVAWQPVESPAPDEESQQVADAALIAAARSDVPELVAEVMRLQGALTAIAMGSLGSDAKTLRRIAREHLGWDAPE